MKHVRQEGLWGCAIACFAMITGWSYRDVKSLFPDEVEHSEGLSQWEILQALSWFGYSFRIFGVGKYRYWPHEQSAGLADHSEKRHLLALKKAGTDWPDLKDAPVLLVTVRAADNGLHCVVVKSDGTVLDPFLDHLTTLDTYIEIVWVAGIYPIVPRDAPA